MKKLNLATAVLASVFAMGANAYQAEVGGSLIFTDPDEGKSATGVAVDGTYYLAPVQTKNGPLNEAGFLNRASNVKAAIAYNTAQNTDTIYSHNSADRDDNKSYSVGGEYFVPNTDFYVSADLGYLDTKNGTAGDTVSYAAEVGYFAVPNFLLAVGFAGQDERKGDSDTDPTLRAKYVTNLGGYDVNLEAGARFGDDNAYGFGGDVYLDKTFSVGLGYADSDEKNSDDVFTIRAKKFFTEQISVEANMNFADSDTYGIRAAYRF